MDGSKHDAVKILRDQIIAEITKRPDVKYELTKLLYGDAASCFPNGFYQWDGAFFQLDLINRKLLVEVSTYPNQFGACEQDFFSLSPAKFNRIAKEYHMRPELQAFHSDEDWAMLFDDNLEAAISSACTALQRQEEERKNMQRKMLAVKIPSELAGLLPDMNISEVTIELIQRYGRSSIQIVNENGEYHIHSFRTSHASDPRILSSAEAKWLEQQIENTVNDPDDSVWQSLPGGDTMNIAIKWNHGKDITIRGVKAISKYVALMNKLRNLTEYGSQEELK